MAKDIETEYVHRIGSVVISQEIGKGRYLWGAFIRKPNGSLRRICQIQMNHDPAMVAYHLGVYKGKAIQHKLLAPAAKAFSQAEDKAFFKPVKSVAKKLL